MGTFDDFFSDDFFSITVDEVVAKQAAIMAKLAEAEPWLTAAASKDNDTRVYAMKQLAKLGYAQRVETEREGYYRWELLRNTINDDRAYAQADPARIVAEFGGDPR